MGGEPQSLEVRNSFTPLQSKADNGPESNGRRTPFLKPTLPKWDILSQPVGAVSVQYKTNQAPSSGPDTPHITRDRKGSPVKYESQNAEEFGTAVGQFGDQALEGVESVPEEAELRSGECFF